MADITPEEVAANNTVDIQDNSVPVTIVPADNSSNDTVGDILVYNEGTTVVLTAPESFKGNAFSEWRVTNNTTSVTTNYNTPSINLNVDGDYTAAVFYKNSQLVVDAMVTLGLAKSGNTVNVTIDTIITLGLNKANPINLEPSADVEYALGVLPQSLTLAPLIDAEVAIV